jgi:hypothetical protein
MSVCKKAMARIAPVAFTLATWTCDVAWSEPVRITVSFNVMGDNEASGGSPSDPVDGRRTGFGSFSIVATRPAGGGQLEDFTRGLHADSVAFTWAGTSWTRTTADVGRLIFDPHGTLVYWQLAGLPDGLVNITAGIAPDIYLDPFAFLYTTRRASVSLYEGSILSAAVTITPTNAPPPSSDPGSVPEPTSLALVASGVVVLAGVKGRLFGFC